jgi:hypothetical protein
MRHFVALRTWVQNHPTCTLLLVAMLMLGGIAARGVHFRMHHVIHARFSRDLLAAAVSMRYHGGVPYATYAETQQIVYYGVCSQLPWLDIAAGRVSDYSHFSNDSLSRARATPPVDPDNVKCLVDDRGMVDFLLLSFCLFGVTVRGIFFTILVLLLVTVLAFFVTFRHRPDFCLAPVLILAGNLTGMPALLLTQELFSLTNPRTIDLLGLIPAAHLLCLCVDRQRLSWLRVAATAVQVLVIVECCHARSSALWLVLAVVGAFSLLAAVRVVRSGPRWAPGAPLRALVGNAWAVALLLAGLAGLKLYQSAVYDHGHTPTHPPHHVVWHNIGLGLALHPELASLYELRIRDNCMLELVKRRLAERGDTALIEAIYGNFPKRVNWQLHDEQAREAVLAIVRAHPGEIVELCCYYKPLLALRSLAWAAGLHRFDAEALHIYDQATPPSSPLAPPAVVAALGLRVRLGELLLLALPLTCVSRWCGVRGRVLAKHGVLLLTLLLGSLLPAAATYPVLHVVGVSILAASALALALAMLVLYAVAHVVAKRGANAAP